MKKLLVLILLLLAIQSCDEPSLDKNANLLFENNYFSSINYSFRFIEKDTNSIYIFRSSFEYSGSACLQIQKDGKCIYYELDEQPYYFDNQRRINTFSNRKSNPTVEITRLNGTKKVVSFKSYRDYFLKQNYSNLLMYRNYTICIPRENKIISIPCRFPSNNYSKKEVELLNWIKMTMTNISYKEELFYNLFLDYNLKSSIDDSFQDAPQYYKYKNFTHYLVPSKDIQLFYHGSINDSIGTYD